MSDEQLKYRIEEILRLMNYAVLKVDENAKEMALLRRDVDQNTRELKKLRKDIRTGFGFDTDLYFRVLEMHNRLWEIENQVKIAANRFPFLKAEYDRIYSESLKLFTNIENNPDAKMQIDELNVWVENLEEKVFV